MASWVIQQKPRVLAGASILPTPSDQLPTPKTRGVFQEDTRRALSANNFVVPNSMIQAQT